MRNQRTFSTCLEDFPGGLRRTPEDIDAAIRSDVLRKYFGKHLHKHLRRLRKLRAAGFPVWIPTEEEYYENLIIVGTAEDFAAMGLPPVEEEDFSTQERMTEEEVLQFLLQLQKECPREDSSTEKPKENILEEIPEDIPVEEEKVEEGLPRRIRPTRFLF